MGSQVFHPVGSFGQTADRGWQDRARTRIAQPGPSDGWWGRDYIWSPGKMSRSHFVIICVWLVAGRVLCDLPEALVLYSFCGYEPGWVECKQPTKLESFLSLGTNAAHTQPQPKPEQAVYQSLMMPYF